MSKTGANNDLCMKCIQLVVQDQDFMAFSMYTVHLSCRHICMSVGHISLFNQEINSTPRNNVVPSKLVIIVNVLD